MSKPVKQIHLAAHFPGVNNTTVWSDPAAGSHIDFTSFVHFAQTAERAGISPQYLSEVERGRKEPSSEMIAALAGALGTTLIGLTEQVTDDLRRQDAAWASRASGPVMLSLAA